MQQLRLMEERDLESIYAIYVYYVQHSAAIFDIEPYSFEVFKKNMLQISKTSPFYLAIIDHELIGY